MRIKGMQSSSSGSPFGVRPLVVLGMLLGTVLLASGDLMEIIPIFAPLVASPLFPFFHEIHDLLALGVVLFTAYRYPPRLAAVAMLAYLAVHIPYFINQFPTHSTEILRVLVSSFAAIFGVWIIDQLHKSEGKLRVSEGRYRNLVSTALVGIYRANLKGDILYANNAMAGIFGFDSVEELIAIGALTRYKNPSDRAALIKELAERGKVANFETELLTKKGEIINVVMNTVLEGENLSGMLMDITERKRAEEKIARLASFPELNPSPVLELDYAGNVTYLNPACKSIFPDLVTLGVNHPFLLDFPQVVKELQSNNWPIPVVREVGVNSLFYEQLISPTAENQIRIYSTDITERKKMQEQLMAQDRLASIGQLVSGVAHEINNPLTGVIGFSELLLKRDLPDDVKADLKIVNDEAMRTSKIVKNLLTFARKQPEGKAPVDIDEQIQRVLDLRDHEQKVNNISVATRFASDLPQVMGNASQLQQVFFNIVINAEFFMLQAHNKGNLTVTTERKGKFVRASITDDGPGISEENMKSIFNPFFTTKEVGKGTGLGLSICYGIVTEHGGRIYAKSEEGKGATFIVELPVKEVTTSQEVAR